MNVPREQIANDLRKRIISGDLRPGDKVPSGRELAASSGSSYITANEAIKLLAREGLVELRNKSVARVADPDTMMSPEAQLVTARDELAAARETVRELRDDLTELEGRITDALSKIKV